MFSIIHKPSTELMEKKVSAEIEKEKAVADMLHAVADMIRNPNYKKLSIKIKTDQDKDSESEVGANSKGFLSHFKSTKNKVTEMTIDIEETGSTSPIPGSDFAAQMIPTAEPEKG